MNRLLYFFSLILFTTSCVDLTPDEPPACCPDVMIETNSTISDIKALYKPGQFVQITDDLIFEAVVGADDQSGNFYKGLALQDDDAGIEIRIDNTNLYTTLPQGRQVFVKAQGLYIGDYNGLIQLGHSIANNSMQGIPAGIMDDFISAGSPNNNVTITDATINTLNNSMLSRIVRLQGLEFVNPNATYADAINTQSINLDLTDCDENIIVVRTSGFADFAGDQVETGNGEFVGVYSVFGTTKQLLIRNTDDLNMEETRCDGGSSGGGDCNNTGTLGATVDNFDEGFESLAEGVNVNLTGWQNFACVGERVWLTKLFDDNIYAQATAYNDNSPNAVAYLMTPPISFNGNKKLSFRTAMAFYQHDGLEVMISEDYDGKDPADATWTTINANIAGSAQSNYDWVESGTIDMSAYTKDAVVAFKYSGSAASNTTSYIVDDVKIFE